MGSTLIFYYWQSMIVSFLFSRKIVMPFTDLDDMYFNAPNFRLALFPNSIQEDIFKYSNLPVWQSIYKERVQPYLEEYIDYLTVNPSDLIHFIKDDFGTAVYSGTINTK